MKKITLSFFLIAFGFLNVFSQTTSNALHFQNNDYVNINSIASTMDNLNNFTVEFWVRYNGVDNTDYNAFYGVNASDYTNRFLIRCAGPTDGISSQGSAIVLLKSGADRYVKGTTRIDDGACHHIAFTYQNQTCKLYINGNLEATTTYSFQFLYNDIHSLGQEYDPGAVFSEFYNGMMDDFRVWNYAKTQTQIENNRHNELIGTEPGLVCNYDFNQGVPSANNVTITTLINKAQPSMPGILNNFSLNGNTSNFINGSCVGCSLQIDDIQIVNPTCGNLNGQITILHSGQTTGLQFSIDNGVTFQTGNIFNNLPPGTYQIIIKDDAECPVSQSVTLLNVSSPVINNITTTDASCGSSNGSITVIATGGSGALTYSINGTTFQNSTLFSNLSAGNYTIVVKDASGCLTSQSIQVFSENAPVINAVNTTNLTCGINNGMITINASGGVPSYTYSIDNGLTFQASNSFTMLSSGLYNIVVKDNNGCVSSQQVTLITIDAPSVVAGINQTICLGESVTLTATEGITFSWTNGVVNGQSFSPTTTTTYLVTGTDANGCISTDSITVTVNPVPTAQFTVDVAQGDPVLVVNFTNTSVNASSYTWNFGGGSTPITTNLNSNQTHSFPTPGVYNVELIASNGSCSAVFSMPITVFAFPEVEIYIPNVFTPDNNKVNDEFFIDVKNGKTIQVTILNRWGNIMYEINNFNDAWNGLDATDGVYFFKYEIIDLHDKVHAGHGHVTLKR